MTIVASIAKPVHRLLTDNGYGVVGRELHHGIALGSVLVVHFGDRLTLTADGRPQLTLRAALEIGGATHGDSKVMHWTLQKSAPALRRIRTDAVQSRD